MSLRFHRLVAILACALPVFTAHAAAPATLVRFPSSSADALAFVAHGDLWRSARDGGAAQRLVHSAGRIVGARFSPDGRWIAYTERAHGGQDVWIVAVGGGAPRRLTHDTRAGAGGNLVVAWSPDSRRIVFLSDRMSVSSKQVQAFSVPLEGGLATRLPLDQSGTLAYAPDGRTLAYTRTFTDLASRKRYTGGMAEDIHIYDMATRKATRLTDWKGTDTMPMWAGRRLYFLSDRGPEFRLNLWRYDPAGSAGQQFTQITHFTDTDIDWPALGGGRITFQQAGRVWALNLADERVHALAIDVPDDGEHTAARTFDASGQARATDVTGAVDYALAPDGSTMLIGAHGDIFQVPLAAGPARDLTATPDLAEQHPAVSPDGRTLAYISEDGAAQQVTVRALAGGPERRLTHFASGVFYAPLFAPDGRHLAVASAEHQLWLVPLDGAAARLVATDPAAEIRDAAFSPDGRWLAYSTLRATGLNALHLYDIAAARDIVLSTALDGDRMPAFSTDSATLLFVSRRHERTMTSDRGDEATLATLESDGIYALPLAGIKQDMPAGAAMRNAYALPLAGGRIVSLQVRGATLFYEARPPALIDGDAPSGHAILHAFDLAANADRALVQDFDDQVLSADGRMVLFRRDGGWWRQSVGTDTIAPAVQAVKLAGLTLQVDPRAEWREMFEHAWRLDRDLFFSRVMNGSDWQAVHDTYAKLVPLIGSHDDMLYLIGQLQGELATSHAFIASIDAGEPGPVQRTPLLGADLALDASSGRYYFEHVYDGDPTRARYRSPLNAPGPGGGVHVDAGAWLMAVDGVDLKAPLDPDSLLAGKHGAVTLGVAAKPGAPMHQVRIEPVSDDGDLRQYAWVEKNRARIAALSSGRIGYVFLTDFHARGAEDLLRQLQGQLDKEGLVIDVRWNGGGFTSQAVLDLLRRVHAGIFVNREGAVAPLPLFVAPRTMAVVTNAQSASDGDQFPYFFRAYGLGPVIGQRTWGGVQGIKGPWPLMDGTRITIPKDSLASLDGHWLIENAGVTPDVAVEPDVDEGTTGRDRLLETAVQNVLGRLPAKPAAPLQVPAPLPAYPADGDVPPARF